ncbi:MAG: hypothetical protein ACE15C_08960 [Phycisphaerae bacterium]
MTRQFILTSSMSKRLIGKAMAVHPAVQAVLKKGTLVIVAGTTNGYVAEEVLLATSQAARFNRKGFRRGMVTPPGAGAPKADFPGDVVLIDGAWQRGKEIFDVVDTMQSGDLILKGGNALDLATGRAAVLIGHPMAGTVGAAMPAVLGRRVQLIIPIGLEKRVPGPLEDIAADLNAPGVEGPRMVVMPGKAFTELDAIRLLTGAVAQLVAAGGVHGAEGAVWLAVSGDDPHVRAAGELIQSVANEPACEA